jgi:hypothetical protein
MRTHVAFVDIYAAKTSALVAAVACAGEGRHGIGAGSVAVAIVGSGRALVNVRAAGAASGKATIAGAGEATRRIRA